MEKLLSDVGVEIEKFEIRDVEVDFQRWVQMTGTKLETVKIIKEDLVKEINGGSKTGMRPFMKNGGLKFLQVWAVVIGMKTPATNRQDR